MIPHRIAIPIFMVAEFQGALVAMYALRSLNIPISIHFAVTVLSAFVIGFPIVIVEVWLIDLVVRRIKKTWRN